jgi:coproporphyrinogen III oxidase-like Fe-S oxidoreductase
MLGTYDTLGEWLIGASHVQFVATWWGVSRNGLEQPRVGWFPQPLKKLSLYLHVPYCRHLCPYCPYTKVPYQESLMEPYTRAALREVDGWAETIGPTEITSIYMGGGHTYPGSGKC